MTYKFGLRTCRASPGLASPAPSSHSSLHRAGVTLLAAPKDAESTLPVVVLEDTVLAAGSGKTVDDGVVVTVTLGRTSRTMVTPPLHGLQDTAVACMLALFTC